MEFYYYNHMGKTWQSAYHAILTGLEELRPAFPVPRLEMEELGQILFQLRLDHPVCQKCFTHRAQRDLTKDPAVPLTCDLFDGSCRLFI